MAWLLESGSSESLEEILARENRQQLPTGSLSIPRILYLQPRTLRGNSPNREIERKVEEKVDRDRRRVREEID